VAEQRDQRPDRIQRRERRVPARCAQLFEIDRRSGRARRMGVERRVVLRPSHGQRDLPRHLGDTPLRGHYPALYRELAAHVVGLDVLAGLGELHTRPPRPVPGQLPHRVRDPGIGRGQPLRHGVRVGEDGHDGVDPRPPQPVDAVVGADAVELLGGEPAVELARRAAQAERIRGDRPPTADLTHPSLQRPRESHRGELVDRGRECGVGGTEQGTQLLPRRGATESEQRLGDLQRGLGELQQRPVDRRLGGEPVGQHGQIGGRGVAQHVGPGAQDRLQLRRAQRAEPRAQPGRPAHEQQGRPERRQDGPMCRRVAARRRTSGTPVQKCRTGVPVVHWRRSAAQLWRTPFRSAPWTPAGRVGSRPAPGVHVPTCRHLR
jgi:hypothetical protein